MNDITALRGHLFDTLRGLKDGSIEIDKAKAVSQIADTIIDTAKVEVDYMRVTGATGTGFIAQHSQVDSGRQVSRTQTGIKTVEGNTTVHRLK